MHTIGWLIPRMMIPPFDDYVVDGQKPDLRLDIMIGTAGALLGRFMLDLLGLSGLTGLNLYGTIMTVTDAVVVQ